ncbi:MAG: hypothetical protein JSS21_11620 [Proteobacteria bacterium]|nr:hypothetical protein [Pseudomonadota bacterium]
MRTHAFATVGLAAVLAMAATPVLASWSNTAASNFVIGNGKLGEQAQPKILPTPDGGCWISWFDDSTGGYSVRIQRLDSVGNRMLGTHGVLVAKRYFSSTQDYGLSEDASGNALLAFRVSDTNQENIKIEAQKIAPDGTLMWGASGIQLGNTADFLADPKITATSDGGVVFGWTDNSDMEFARLDAGGNQQWETTISDPGGASLTLSDLHASTNGTVIFSYVSATGFSGPKHLLAQKLDTSGLSKWTTAVYDAGSLQFGNFPTFIPDGTGGAVFAWYDSTNLQSHVQHLTPNGFETFPHNGVLVANVAGDIQVEPSAAYNQATRDIFVFWTEADALTQGNVGISGQRVDASGNLAWGSSGVTIVPKTTNADYLADTVATSDDGAIVFYSGAVGFGQDQVHAARLDTNGSYLWNPGIVSVSSTPAQKFRLTSTILPNDMAIATWEDIGTNSGNILAQNINGDGTLGASCPDGYTAYPGNLAPGGSGSSPGYVARAGMENGILISPPGFRLFAKWQVPGKDPQQIGSNSSNEIHQQGPAGRYQWIAQAGTASPGGDYILCVKHP